MLLLLMLLRGLRGLIRPFKGLNAPVTNAPTTAKALRGLIRPFAITGMLVPLLLLLVLLLLPLLLPLLLQYC